MKYLSNITILLVIHAAFANSHAGYLPDIGSISDGVLVVSHRAHYGEAPENSLAAIQACIKGGVDAVEIDVTRTKDGKLVLMHDKTVDRTTNGSGNIEEMTWADVKKLRLRKRSKRRELTEESVPTLEEALALCRDRVYVNLDMKEISLFDCEDVIRATGTENIIMYRSTSLDWLKRVAARFPQMLISPRLDFSKKEVIWPGKDTGLDFLKPYEDAIDLWGVGFADLNHPAASKENLRALKEKKLRVWVLTLWGRYSDQNALEHPGEVWGTLIERGFDVIMTSESEALLHYLESIDRLQEFAPQKVE